MKQGDKVVYQKPMQGLDSDSVGVLMSIHDANNNNPKPWGVVVYEQNLKLNRIYCHSANLEDLKPHTP